ncbi:hypothetical protein AT00_14175 [Pseudoalteromonas lipolytica SCSIO 04301]|uniref:DUF2779 domain-containing protein n=1 Tax=Pseudoalteromonas lipolytica TaxID=570156 RepID=UPI0004526F64|nr:DUF2779 domain-containing protein [Pseudoalteromonas lipolytica]EWH05770.1 hypothetical protein AT00_14175 [Pseudoalteromonas lipolytica SCSIO 04301]
MLTKTDFQTARICIKRLWHEKKGLWTKEQSVADLKNTFEGNRFSEAVREFYPNGIMIGWQHGSLDEALTKTKQELKAENVILFEAAFEHDGLLCLADVVIKENGILTLIEAKSSNSPKILKKDNYEHVYDAAFQHYVMSKCGYTPDKVELMHSNGNCIWPDRQNLFSFEDITDLVNERLGEVEVTSSFFMEKLERNTAPSVQIGKFCKKPKDKACPHINECWRQETQNTIFDLPRLPIKTEELLRDNDIHLIEDIPSDIELSESLRRKVELIQNKTEYIDRTKAKEMLESLEYPIHFFDFETYNPAIPMWNNSRPWQQVPFQYSLHILYEDGKLVHYDYLHESLDEPREPLINAMKQHFENIGSVVVYYEPFEKSRLQEMAKDFPQHQEFLNSVNQRVWDQMHIFTKCVEDHRLALSTSIKVVLPTFVPTLSYKNLAVQKGDQAQLEWRRMLDIKWEPTKRQKITDLKAYCELDTLAMVKLHEYFTNIVMNEKQ